MSDVRLLLEYGYFRPNPLSGVTNPQETWDDGGRLPEGFRTVRSHLPLSHREYGPLTPTSRGRERGEQGVVQVYRLINSRVLGLFLSGPKVKTV